MLDAISKKSANSAIQPNGEIVWLAPEFSYTEKGPGWYWLTLIASAVIFLVAVWQGNILFSIFIVAAEIMLLYWARQNPKTIEFRITAEGFKIGNIKTYEFENLAGFSIVEGRDSSELILKTNTMLHPYVRVYIFNKDQDLIKAFLHKHLEEIEYNEPFSEGISRIIGF